MYDAGPSIYSTDRNGLAEVDKYVEEKVERSLSRTEMQKTRQLGELSGFFK